jgi:hypothetical protein
LLVLWQVGVIGRVDHASEPHPTALKLLVERLRRFYAPDHEVIAYEAPPYEIARPVVLRGTLETLAQMPLPPLATLVIPPARKPRRDLRVLERLARPS